jgi:hypothetical protein
MIISSLPPLSYRVAYLCPTKSLFGKLLAAASTGYNICFRALFLATIKPPSTPWEIFSGQIVVQTTRFCNAAQRVVGFQNILYVALVALCARAYDSYALFLVCTSFVHYLRYMTTYYVRENVAFEAFKRDVLFFKSLALAQVRDGSAPASDEERWSINTLTTS